MMDKEKKMMGLMMDMCCKNLSEKDRQKMRDMCRDMAERIPACCKNMDVSSFIEQCLSKSAADKSGTRGTV